MTLRTGALLLAALLLLPAAGAAQSREPRYVSGHTLDGDPVAVAVGPGSQGAPHVAAATATGVTLLDPQLKVLWQKTVPSLVGVAITGPDVPGGPWVLVAVRDRFFLYDSAGKLLLTSAPPRAIRFVGITPDGGRMLLSQDRYIEVRDKDGGAVWGKDVALPQIWAAIGGDGSVAVLGPDSATLWDPGGGKATRTVSYGTLFTPPEARRPVGIAMLGNDVVLGASDGAYLLDRPGGQTTFRVPTSLGMVAIQASPNIIAASSTTTVFLRDIFGNPLKVPAPGGEVATIALSPDGRYLATAMKDRRLLLHDLGGVIPAFLVVNSTPSATVRVDGEERGTVPLRLEIFPGPHRVVLSNSTVGEVPVTAVVPFAGEANVSLNLSRLAYPAALEVNSVPAGAEVAVDGGSLGNAPLTSSLSPGNHTLRVALPGFSPYLATVNLTTDNLTRLNVTLAPAGQVSSAAAPSLQKIPPNSIQPPAAGRNATWEIKLVTPPPTAASPTPTPEQPGFEALFAAAALLLVGLAARRRR